jgi:hypothetical protein
MTKRKGAQQGRGNYLAWRELAAWLVVHGATGGGEAGGVHWSRLEDEGAESCKGEGKLTAGAVGVAEERAATPAAFEKEESFWARWWLLALLSPPLLESRWQRRRFLQRREGEKWCNCHVRWFYGYWRWV